jgi:glycosyltransferase involved in cell wall biosynthesis
MLVILTSHPIQYQAPLWRALAKDGRVTFEVWFLTDHAVNPTHDREFGNSFAWDRDLLGGYAHRFLPVRPGWRMDRFRGIRVIESWSKLLKEHGVTRLWVEGWRFSENWAAVFAARRAGVEVWMRGETNDLRPRKGIKEIARRVLLGQLFARVSQFLCIGSANRRFYEGFGIDDARLLPAPYCVDNAWFAAQTEMVRDQRPSIRAQMGIPEDAFCLLFCGKFIPKKRPMDLVDAVQHAMKNPLGRKFHLLFVGSGILGDDLRAACKIVFDADNPDLQPFNTAVFKGDTVSVLDPLLRHPPTETQHQVPPASFAGFLNQGEIIRAYVAADCLVLPSDTGETWGLVVNEAMACGLPCVVSDACGCAEDLGSLASGSVFDLGNVGGLAARLVSVATSQPPDSKIYEEFDRDFSLSRTVDSVVVAFAVGR